MYKQAALTWVDRGYAVIPIRDGTDISGNKIKSPHVKWKQYQETKPTKREVSQWWDQWPNAKVALIGGHDGLACWDIDDPILAAKLIPKFESYTRIDVNKKSGKAHIFLREENPSKSGPLISGVCDIKAKGGYFIAAPCNGYEKLGGIDDPIPVPAYPTAREYATTLLTGMGYELKEEKKQVATIRKRYEGDGRNNMVTSVAGLLRNYGSSQEMLMDVVKILNEKYCDPPLEEKEWQRTVESISKYPPKKSFDYVQ